MKQLQSGDRDAGFVLVDTLVAVVVISLVLSVCLITVRIASATARNAQDATEARMLLSGLMESTPRTAGIHSGVSGSMSYSIAVTEVEVNSLRLCRLDASVRFKSETSRLSPDGNALVHAG